MPIFRISMPIFIILLWIIVSSPLDGYDDSDFGWRVSIVVRGIWAVPESAMASFIVAQAVSTVVRMVDEKYFWIFITKFQTYKIYVFFQKDMYLSKILKFSSTCLAFRKIFSIWLQTYHGVIKRYTETLPALWYLFMIILAHSGAVQTPCTTTGASKPSRGDLIKIHS